MLRISDEAASRVLSEVAKVGGLHFAICKPCLAEAAFQTTREEWTNHTGDEIDPRSLAASDWMVDTLGIHADNPDRVALALTDPETGIAYSGRK